MGTASARWQRKYSVRHTELMWFTLKRWNMVAKVNTTRYVWIKEETATFLEWILETKKLFFLLFLLWLLTALFLLPHLIAPSSSAVAPDLRIGTICCLFWWTNSSSRITVVDGNMHNIAFSFAELLTIRLKFATYLDGNPANVAYCLRTRPLLIIFQGFANLF